MSKAKAAARAKRRRWLPDPTLLGRLTDTTPLREPEQTGLALPARLAFDAIANGSGGDDDIQVLAVALNGVIVALEHDPLCEQAMQQAQDALMRCKARGETHGRYGWDGPGREAMLVALDLHEQWLAQSTPAQIASAMREVLRRSAAGDVVEVQAC